MILYTWNNYQDQFLSTPSPTVLNTFQYSSSVYLPMAEKSVKPHNILLMREGFYLFSLATGGQGHYNNMSHLLWVVSGISAEC